MVFVPEKTLELQIKNLVCIYVFILRVNGLGPIWPHLLSLCKVKNAKNGISAKTLVSSYTHKPIYLFGINIVGGMF